MGHVLSKYFGFPLSVPFYQCFILIFILIFLLLEGQISGAWEPQKAMLFGFQVALVRKLLLNCFQTLRRASKLCLNTFRAITCYLVSCPSPSAGFGLQGMQMVMKIYVGQVDNCEI
jgi:hypothetical protein